MMFAVIGFFRSGADPARPALQADWNEHLGASAHTLRHAGFLVDEHGRKAGVMGLLEADDFARAQAYLRTSPFTEAGLYERTAVLEFAEEVGRL
ncbi:MAG: YciI family protein [Phenylobacterium sp.]|nr:YciI family protein [Phenylobacterium sp.]